MKVNKKLRTRKRLFLQILSANISSNKSDGISLCVEYKVNIDKIAFKKVVSPQSNFFAIIGSVNKSKCRPTVKIFV